ncbi:tyrosine-type recombinase/integrase [Alsobacter sp. SYSU M60028]|uniref:Tyrosine-type recombinase/integrase n=1 Tax=Alsobacter ponti TaxID=2962936 RepID=A0ABT1LD19_9HYPH|nr:site-specific integrase [Alsobacter ponti]MCP8939402.1 tyrosine-type recombinase/integrase [Alsobacter ponti]
MAKILTTKAVETAQPGPARREIPDGILPGLYLIVQPSGARSWAVRFRIDGRPRKHTLGAFPTVDLATARELGRAALTKVHAGVDPTDERNERRAAAKAARNATADLMHNVSEEFLKRHVRTKTRASSARETERILNVDVLPAWKGRRVQSITRRDVIALLDSVVDRGAPILANRVLAVVRRMFSWCVERGILEASPAAGVKAPSVERSRDRVLSDEELRVVLAAFDDIGWPFGPLFKVLLLTAQRRDEVGEMRWSEVDLGRRIWTIPRERAKNDQAHEVPLSEPVVAILKELPRIEGRAGFVFTTTGTTPLGGYSRAKSRLDGFVLARLRSENLDAEPLPRWTLHDLRRTAATNMARLGVSQIVVEKVINHISGSLSGVAGIYNRHSFADEKRAALVAWAKWVEELSQ